MARRASPIDGWVVSGCAVALKGGPGNQPSHWDASGSAEEVQQTVLLVIIGSETQPSRVVPGEWVTPGPARGWTAPGTPTTTGWGR